jgi:hypothetical protein
MRFVSIDLFWKLPQGSLQSRTLRNQVDEGQIGLFPLLLTSPSLLIVLLSTSMIPTTDEAVIINASAIFG